MATPCKIENGSPTFEIGLSSATLITHDHSIKFLLVGHHRLFRAKILHQLRIISQYCCVRGLS